MCWNVWDILVFRGNTIIFQEKSVCSSAKKDRKLACFYLELILAYNVKSKEEVHEIIELVRNAGGTIAKEPGEVFWGRYHPYFSDPDDHYWKIAYNPNWTFDEDNMVVL